MNESSIQGFSEDFEQYEYSVVEDGHACPICTALNGKVFNIKDRVPGVNFPPMHPWYRCTFKIHVDDWSEWLKTQSNKTRAEKVLNNSSDDDIVENRNVLKLNVQLFAKKSSDFKTVVLPPKEYGKVMHTLATDISKEQLNKKTFYKSIGDYIYYVENNGFGNFRIIGKSKIK